MLQFIYCLSLSPLVSVLGGTSPSPLPLLPRVPFPPWCCLFLVVCFAGFFGLVLLALPAYPVLSLLFGLVIVWFPRVRCLVFLAVDWSRISSTFSPLPYWFGSALSFRIGYLFVLPPLQILQCGTSGRRLVRGITTLAPPTNTICALSLAVDWSRGFASQFWLWTSLLGSKRNTIGSKLIP